MSRAMVLIDEQADPTRIVGYHTLPMGQVRKEDISKDKSKIKRSIPVVLLGQLGVDRGFQGSTLG